jgi:hypothetical protein
MEDDLKKKKKNKNSQFLLNLGANLSWDWLSSLRFFNRVKLINLIILTFNHFIPPLKKKMRSGKMNLESFTPPSKSGNILPTPGEAKAKAMHYYYYIIIQDK